MPARVVLAAATPAHGAAGGEASYGAGTTGSSMDEAVSPVR